jgi:hypothetical protein
MLGLDLESSSPQWWLARSFAFFSWIVFYLGDIIATVALFKNIEWKHDAYL